MSYYRTGKNGEFYSYAEESYEHCGVVYEPSVVGYKQLDDSPLFGSMKELSDISDGKYIDSESGDIAGLYNNAYWLEDKVICDFTFNARYKDKRDIIHFVVEYPKTTLASCLACGAPCSLEKRVCKRCVPLVEQIIQEDKETRRIRKELREAAKVIKHFEEKIHERYWRHQNQASNPLAKV